MADRTAEQPRSWVLLGAALTLVAGVYVNALNVGFMWDDHPLIVENLDLHELHAPWVYLGRSFWQHAFFYGNADPFFRPLVTFSFAVDWAVGGGAAFGFHATNVLLHLGVCAALFALMQRHSGSASTAAVATALFGVMPRLTESVTWVCGRTDVIAAGFVLLALLAAGRPRSRWAVGPALLLGLLAKEIALVGCVMIAGSAALPVLRTRAFRREALAPLLHVLGAVLVWAALRGPSSHAPPVLHSGATFLAGVGQHVAMVLSPWDPQAQIGLVLAPPPWAAPLGGFALAALAAGAVGLFRRAADVALWWLLGAALAVFAVTAVRLSVYTLASDRFLYLPLALGLGALASRPWPRWALALAALGALALAPVVVGRNDLWAAPIRFWRQTTATADPRSPGAVMALGDVLCDAVRLEEALPLYEQAVRLTAAQRHSSARLSRVVVLSKLGRDAEALEAIDALIAGARDWKRALYARVLVRARAEDLDGAQKALDEARSMFGDDDVLRSLSSLLEGTARVALDGQGVERARALASLGAIRKAEAVYLELLTNAEVGTEAAQWLVVFGSRPAAERALAALQGSAAAQAQFDERFTD